MAVIITVSWRNGCVSWRLDVGCANCSASQADKSAEPIIYSGGLAG